MTTFLFIFCKISSVQKAATITGSARLDEARGIMQPAVEPETSSLELAFIWTLHVLVHLEAQLDKPLRAEYKLSPLLFLCIFHSKFIYHINKKPEIASSVNTRQKVWSTTCFSISHSIEESSFWEDDSWQSCLAFNEPWSSPSDNYIRYPLHSLFCTLFIRAHLASSFHLCPVFLKCSLIFRFSD